MKRLLLLIACMTLCTSVMAEKNIATLRGDSALDREPEPPFMAKPTKDDIRKKRSYPMQPPVIPHNIRDYQVDLKVNKCLSCHARSQAEDAQAPMISVTHYMGPGR